MPPYVTRVGRRIASTAASWSANNSSTTGAALAFYSAFSLAPLLVIILTLAGWIVGEQFAYGQVFGQLNALFGPATAKTLMEAVKNSQRTEGLVSTIVSIVTLIIGATTVLSALESALEKIWHAEALVPKGLRGWVRSRLLSLGFVLTLGFLLLISLAVTTGLSNLRKRIATDHTAIVSVLGTFDLVASVAIVAALFALIFRYMPARRTAWKAALTGGLLTALLFDTGRWAVGLYLAHSTQPSAFGAAASFVALLLWLYYTAQIFLFGAEFTAALGGVNRDTAPPSAAKSTAPYGAPSSIARSAASQSSSSPPGANPRRSAR
jgi:membrane protein